MKLTRKLRYWLEAAVFFTFIGVFRALGVDGASALGGFLGRNILYRTPLSDRARANLKTAYPEKSAGEVETVVREMWDNLASIRIPTGQAPEAWPSLESPPSCSSVASVRCS